MLILGLLCVKETELVAEKAYEMAINGETLEICHRERPFGMILLNGSKNAEVLCNMNAHWELLSSLSIFSGILKI